MEELNNLLNEFANIFGFSEFDEEFINYLKKISKPNNQICNKNVKAGEGGWKCLDCEMNGCLLICTECFEKAKEKHKGHKIRFESSSYGFCDCGDPNSIKEEGFCPDHLGPFKDDESLYKFIKSGFSEKEFELVDLYLDKIFELLISYISLFENENKYENEIIDILDKIIDFIESCYNNNLCVFHLITLKLIKNYPNKTYHKCFSFDEKTKKINVIKNNGLQHTCICPSLQLLINTLIKKNNEHNSNEFLTLFIQNLKIKLIIGISFFHSFTDSYSSENFRKFSGFSFQICDNNLAEVICSELNRDFFNNFFDECKEVFLEKKENNVEQLNQFLFDFYRLFVNIPQKKYIYNFISNNKIFETIIDFGNSFNNYIYFENKLSFDEFETKTYDFNKMIVEIYLLFIFNLLTSLLDYTEKNITQIKYILNYLLKKILDYQIFKKTNLKKTFTFHITLGRLYAIFINRFCFSLSIEKHIDLYEAFQYIQRLIPIEYDTIHQFLLKELLTFFTFMCSLNYKFFIYYGEDMKLYSLNYFMKRKFIICDFVLFKYLISLKENIRFLELNQLLDIICIEDNNSFFKKHILQKSNIFSEIKNLFSKTKEDEDNENNFFLLNSILQLILIIIRDDNFLFELAFECVTDFKMSYKDELLKNIYEIEKDNLNELFKKNVFVEILGNKNLMSIAECEKKITKYTYYFEINNIEKIFIENCNNVKSKNNLIKFSIKNELLHLFDLDYIPFFSSIETAKKYLMEFKKKNFNLLNTVFSPCLDIQKQLNSSNIHNFLIETKNYNSFLNIFKKIITNSSYLSHIFLYTISKYICVYISFQGNNITNSFKNEILSAIQSSKLNDEIYLSYFEYIKTILNKNIGNNIIDNKLNVEKKNDDFKNKKEQMKNKYKKQFSELNSKFYQNFNQDINSNEMEQENENNFEICVICREKLDPNNLNNFYGKICFSVNDYFNDNMRVNQTQNKQKKHRFVSCNHKCHYNCYLEIIFIKSSQYYKYEFFCPLCKELSNLYLSDLSHIFFTNNNINKSYVQGILLNGDDKDFFIQNLEENNIIIQCRNVIEDFATKLLKQNVLLKDMNENQELFNLFFDKLFNDFMVLFSYYKFSDNKILQIDIWKNILLSIRLLFKCSQLKYYESLLEEFNEKLKLINSIEQNEKINQELIFIYNFLGRFIFLFALLIDFNNSFEFWFKKIIENNILQFYIISSYYNFINELATNNLKPITLNDFLNNPDYYKYIEPFYDLYKTQNEVFYYLINNNVKEIDSKNEFITPSLESCINLIKSKSNLSLIENALNSKTSEIINSFHFPKLNFIDLPESCYDLFSYYAKMECCSCHKKEINGYICLTCGGKICNKRICQSEINDKGKREYSLFDHSKKCNGGTTIYLALNSTQIVYFLKRKIINSSFYLYVNKYGEHAEENNFSLEFHLDNNLYEKAKNNFVNLKFRKK